MVASIQDLSKELVDLVASTATFKRRGFSVFDLDDFQQLSSVGSTYPLAGIRYEGCQVMQPTPARPSTQSNRTNLLEVSFSIILAVEYRAAGAEDTKVHAMELLDELRKLVMGYSKVNTRIWTLVSEVPIDTDIGGVIFYGQLWQTVIPLIGNFKQS